MRNYLVVTVTCWQGCARAWPPTWPKCPIRGIRAGCAIRWRRCYWLRWAVLAGARSFTAIGEWAADAPPRVLAALGVRYGPLDRLFRPPDEAMAEARAGPRSGQARAVPRLARMMLPMPPGSVRSSGELGCEFAQWDFVGLGEGWEGVHDVGQGCQGDACANRDAGL